MEFSFDLSSLFEINQYGIATLAKNNIVANVKQNPQSQFNYSLYQQQNQPNKWDSQQQIKHVIDTIGELSRIAQKLGQIVTTYEKLKLSDDILFLKIQDNQVQGLLRIGQKNLYYADRCGKMINLKPQCVLDFYVHESCQRMGIGKGNVYQTTSGQYGQQGNKYY